MGSKDEGTLHNPPDEIHCCTGLYFLGEDISKVIIQRHSISQDGLLVTVRGNITSKWLAKAITRVHIAIIRLGDKAECFKRVKITSC